MNKRKLSIVGGALVIIASIFFAMKIATPEEQTARKQVVSDLKLVRTSLVKNQDVNSSVAVTGKLEAKNKIEIYAEVSGVMLEASKEFKPGNYYRKGEVLVKLDDSEARLDMLAQKSNVLNQITLILPEIKIDYSQSASEWLEYVESFDVNKPLPELPEPKNDQEKYFFAAQNVYNLYYTIKSAESRLAKYTIYAPYDGVITEAAITPGTLVRTGQLLGEFINPNVYEMEVAISLNESEFVKVGDDVQLQSADVNGDWNGKVIRVGNKIDPNTQTLKAYVQASGKGLKEGMYLKGRINADIINDALEVPRKLLMNDRELYVVKDSMLVSKTVEIVKLNDETVIVRGLEDGTEIIRENLTGAYDGMKVKTYN
ncbi:efflux RND transporter periplasmic adaptor subunit [Chondrinema litorale]|uniref:efflux RND transporter periplasmic adaptor subunit n=1 Tax=Chondrinema litorale TaxID=2994555 RepID=UPI002542B902|nr:HlyD family efflux transporter periplasmic adaptor subunit [Chondrinema litorale]UZR93656.1 HlyD family efflux transporter periplasmic adaptor subunit [Chondrinema litorale]